MFRSWVKKSHIILSALLLTACANGPCHPLRHPELAGKKPTGTASPESESAAKGKTLSELKITDDRVYVYKPDGSIQCEMAKGITPEEMEKELAGIKVYSRENRPDGKMRMQVCGTPTGLVNIYEIPASSLKEAEKRGFKKFEP